jgi:phosphoserine phosphatase RsbU/P
MAAHLSPSLVRACRSFAAGASFAAILLGGLILLGWLFDLPALTKIFPGLVAMNPTTALGFVLGGMATWIETGERRTSHLRLQIARACAGVLLIIGAARILGYLFGFDPLVDSLLFRSQLDREVPPNRIAPNTALDFLITGLALLTIDLELRRGWRPAQLLALTAAIIAALAFMGYAYSVVLLSRVASYIPMALHTAVGFLMLSAAILCARPEKGVMAVVVSTAHGGRIFRRLLPAAVATIFVIGWLQLMGESAELYGAQFGAALTVAASITILGSLIWWNALTVNRAEAERERIELELALARENEVEIGFKIQQTLLLEQPPRDLAGIRVAALTIPSQRIDGDFYDFYRHGDRCLDVVIGDVMGKGIPAALLGAATKSYILQALSRLVTLAGPENLPEPREIISLAHAGIVKQLIELGSFVTACYARFDLNRHRLDLVDCGHTEAIHFRHAEHACAMVRGTNLPLGVIEGEIYDQITVPFEPGDILLFYSDGVTEARNGTGEFFGSERLAELVRGFSHLDPEQLVERLRETVASFSGSERFADDLTCVAVTLGEREATRRRAELEFSSKLSELAAARAFVRDFCHALADPPVDEEVVAQLELAVTEATSNVIRHAYGGRTDQQIQLDADAFADRIVLRLHHLGASFDPEAVSPPAFDGSREGGFGMYIIAHSVDDVRYYRDQRGRNCIALVKRRRACA